MLQRFLLACLIFICTTSGALAQGQSTVLTRNAKGRYFYTHIANAADVPKSVLYERAKPFVTDVLDAADSYTNGDGSGDDSLSTIVYVTLDDSPNMKNQVVDFKVQLTFLDGMVIFKARDFIYRGRRTADGVEINTPLYKMEGIEDAAQTWAITAFDETLKLLMAQMDRSLIGK